MKLILASASPRRAEILRNGGFKFEVCPADVDESALPAEGVEDYVKRIAADKVLAAARKVRPTEMRTIVIGADTVVYVNGEILGKPENGNDARRMLKILSGAEHSVFTGLAFLSSPDGRKATYVETTRVTFVELSRDEIDWYIATGEPLDKAGAYGIQGIGGRFVRRMEGCYFNVMGLPLSSMWSILKSFGWEDSR